MAGRRAPTAVVLAMVICGLVLAASLTGAAVLRVRNSSGHTMPGPTSDTAVTTGNACKREPCQTLATATVGGTVVELVADSGAASGRLHIGVPGATRQIIEATITDMGVTLSQDSLQCVPAAVSACLIRGVGDKGTAGQIVVGRSDKWSPLGRAFVSRAGLLSLAPVLGDSAPEVIAVQWDCARGEDCARRPVYAQVFGLGGQEVGCTRAFARVDLLPGWPNIAPAAASLRDCP
ncbi:hypothetical protein [Actinokineospora sp. NBRC 105648]|uniref:hypothetical protein n=1 Tax=Actinokineospora sp. NBRC 105648 TaxID=3032206 RepID=UPI0024A30555|nr:hypothetical protein [Actinokineospora sp. NBRC 105648]GLZ38556.1 hypothetical protein Acsp05_21800 [Actinokineospora sp. NBRC 105648]